MAFAQREFYRMMRSQALLREGDEYFCSVLGCGKKFNSRFCLKRHFLTIHMGIKRFSCKICGRNFAQKQYLQEHINIHTLVHPYVCDYPLCAQSFKQKSRLCQHKRSKHGILPPSFGGSNYPNGITAYSYILNPNFAQNPLGSLATQPAQPCDSGTDLELS